jgi:hypothetical protein
MCTTRRDKEKQNKENPTSRRHVPVYLVHVATLEVHLPIWSQTSDTLPYTCSLSSLCLHLPRSSQKLSAVQRGSRFTPNPTAPLFSVHLFAHKLTWVFVSALTSRWPHHHYPHSDTWSQFYLDSSQQQGTKTMKCTVFLPWLTLQVKSTGA